MREYDELTREQQEQVDRYLAANGFDWYAVVYDDGDVNLTHNTGLSSILQCGHDPEDYGIVYMAQCGE